MFADPNVALMAMLMLFFVGMICVFFFLMRAIGTYRHELRESLRRQQQLLTDLEGQLMELSFSMRAVKEAQEAAKTNMVTASAAKASMSFLDPDDSILSLLDGPAPRQAPPPPSPAPDPSLPDYDGRMFTRPPAAGRTILDDYDFPDTRGGQAPAGARGQGAGQKAAPYTNKRGFF